MDFHENFEKGRLWDKKQRIRFQDDLGPGFWDISRITSDK